MDKKIDTVKKYFINAFIMIFLTAVISNIPPFGGITEHGMMVLGVFVAVVYGWFTLDLIWPSAYGFFALGVTGITSITGALSGGFGNVTLLTVLMTMVFAGALEQCNFSEMVGTAVLRQPIFQKSPWLLVAGVWIAGFFMGVVHAVFAAIVLLWSIVGRIATMAGIPKDNPLISFVNIFVVIVTTGGSQIFPFYTQAIMHQGFYSAEFNTLGFIIFAVVPVILATCITSFISVSLFKLDARQFVLPQEIVNELNAKTFSKGQKIAFVVLVVYILALLLPTIAPTLPGVALLKKLGIPGLSLLGALLLHLIHIDGKRLACLEVSFRRYVQWPLILLLAVTFPLADALKAPESGIFAAIEAFILPIVSNMGIVPFVVIAITMLTFLTQISHNIVLSALFLPLMCPIVESIGGHQWMLVFWMLIYVCVNTAFMTPAASVYGGMIYGSEFIHKKWAPVFTTLYTVVLLVICCTIFIPFGLRFL